MAGITFLPRETKLRPGVYVRTINVGGPAVPASPAGVVGMPRTASWGPVGVPTVVSSPDAAKLLFGEPDNGPLMQAFAAGAESLIVVRVGAAGVAAHLDLQDITPAVGVTLTAKYPGVGGNGATGSGLKATLQNHPTDTTRKQLLIYQGTTLVQTVTFVKAPVGSTESDALVSALAASGSDYVVATRGVGAGATLTNVTSQNLTGGTDSAITGSDYTTALGVLEPLTVQFNTLAVDTNDASIQAGVGAWVARVRGDGKRIIAVVGEPTSVALATRMTNAAAFNNPAVVYVGNGFVDTNGVAVEGYLAAARIAAMIAAQPYNESLTRKVMVGAASVLGGLTGPQVDTSILSGALVFSLNGAGQVQVEYGIDTLVTLAGDQDAGWKKIRRVKTRDTLIDRASLLTEPMIGTVTNNSIGQSQVINAVQTVLDGMISEGGLRPGATAALDPANPPTTDSIWLVVSADDLDSVEKLYTTFRLRFSPPA